MSARNDSANFSPLVSRTRANETFRDALRLFVGRGRRYSVKQLSIGTGIQPRMIESFMAPVGSDDYRKPDLEEVLSLCKFLGPEFSSELLGTIEQGAFLLPDIDEPDPGRIAVESVKDAAEVSTITSEGGSVHQLRDVATRMMVRGANLRAAADRGQLNLFDQRRVA